MADSPVSERRKHVTLSNAKFAAMVRPANYEEISRCLTVEKSDRVGAHVKLFDDVNVEKAVLPPAARFSLGLQVVKYSGGDSFAEQVPTDGDGLPDEVAQAFDERQLKDPKAAILAFRVSDAFGELYFLCLEPSPDRFESHLKAKSKGGGIDTDLQFFKQHRFYGDLDTLKREAPLAISSLANALAEAGGICLEATLGEA